MNVMQEIKDLVEQTLAHSGIWVRCGDVLIQVYENRLPGGGVQFNLRNDTQENGADIRVMEATPGHFTMAVVPCGGVSIDYSISKTFDMTDSLEAIRAAFPYGRNIDLIVDDLLVYDGD